MMWFMLLGIDLSGWKKATPSNGCKAATNWGGRQCLLPSIQVPHHTHTTHTHTHNPRQLLFDPHADCHPETVWARWGQVGPGGDGRVPPPPRTMDKRNL